MRLRPKKRITEMIDNVYRGSMLPPTLMDYGDEFVSFGSKAVEPLIDALENRRCYDEDGFEDYGVPSFIMRQLAEFGDKRAVEPICRQLSRPDDHTIGIQNLWLHAAIALGELGHAEAIPALQAALRSKKATEDVVEALKTLGVEIEPKEWGEILEIEPKEWGEIRLRALSKQTLGRFDDFSRVSSEEIGAAMRDLPIIDERAGSKFADQFLGSNVKVGTFERAFGALIKCIVDDNAPLKHKFSVQTLLQRGPGGEFEDISWFDVRAGPDIHELVRVGEDKYLMFVHNNKQF